MRLPGKKDISAALLYVLSAQTSRPLVTLICALALAGLSCAFTVARLEFETSQSALISSGNRLMQSLKVADTFSRHDAFIVAVENKETGRSLEFVRALAPMLEGDRDHFSQVFSRVDPAIFRPWALLYMKPKEIVELTGNLRKHESFIQSLVCAPGLVTFFEEVNKEMTSHMVGRLFTDFLAPSDGGEADPLDLSFMLTALRGMKAAIEGSPSFTSPLRPLFSANAWGKEDEEGYLFAKGKKYLLLFVEPNRTVRGASGQGKALAALRRTVAVMREKFPDVQAGVTGQKALDEDEKNLALHDISVATTASLIGLAALLVFFWRTVRRPLLQMTTQIVGLSLTFGLTTLLIGHLNLLSVTFAPMVLGLGIDYDIHWFSRYNEERSRPGQSTKKVLAVTMENIGPTLLLAALSTCFAFLPLAFGGFKGLAELGIICGMGLFVSSVTTLCLLPALIVLFDRPAPHTPFPGAGQSTRPFVRITRRSAFAILAFTTMASAVSLWGAGKIQFDLNMLHLQSKTAESVVWEKKLIAGSNYPSIYGVFFAHSLAGVAGKTEALRKLPSVSEVQSVESFLPPDQALKIPLVRRINPLIPDIPRTPPPPGFVDVTRLRSVLSRIHFKMEGKGTPSWGVRRPLEMQMEETRSLIGSITRSFQSLEPKVLLHRLKEFEVSLSEDLEDKLSLLHANANTRPMQVSDLPLPIRERFVGPDGLCLIRVFPALDVWNPEFLGTFVRDLRSVDPDVTGDPVTLYVFTREFRDASIRAAVYALIFIFAFLALVMRSAVLALCAIAPLVVGAILTFGFMYLFGVNLNLANTIFLLLVIGAGVEYGVIIVERWRRRRSGGEQAAIPLGTGRGVLLAGLTTTIGFGSLMISRHQGIHSLGLLTTVGSLTVLAVAILSLPALLFIIPETRPGKQGEAVTTEDTEKCSSKEEP